MKIQFLEDVGATLVDDAGNEYDAFFPKGDIQDGDILSDEGEYVTFGDPDGWKMCGLKKTQYKVVD